MSKNTGGPAFPAQFNFQEADDLSRQEGMTLRDYFIAHAPAEPQPWFVPKASEYPLPSDEKWEEFLIEKDIWEKEYQKQRYIQWPGAWADAQLEERGK